MASFCPEGKYTTKDGFYLLPHFAPITHTYYLQFFSPHLPHYLKSISISHCPQPSTVTALTKVISNFPAAKTNNQFPFLIFVTYLQPLLQLISPSSLMGFLHLAFQNTPFSWFSSCFTSFSFSVSSAGFSSSPRPTKVLTFFSYTIKMLMVPKYTPPARSLSPTPNSPSIAQLPFPLAYPIETSTQLSQNSPPYFPFKTCSSGARHSGSCL